MKYKSLIKKGLKMLLILVSTMIGLLFILFIYLLIKSPGKPDPFFDKSGKILENSLSEKIFVEVGGVQQGMFIRGKDLKNPVLLFVTGGPSFSEYFLVEKYPTGLENYFTVCYWEERGGGISYTPQVTLESLTLEQFASDAIEVTNYLRDRFKKEKIYIMAHSGGTAFAIQAVANHPNLFHSYIGVSQITRQAESEKLAYKYMFDQFLKNGNSKLIAQFKKYPIIENDSLILPFFNSVLRDKSMHELGIGTMHNMKSVIKGVFYPVWTCRAYTLKEKFNIWYSKFSFISKSDLREQILKSDIPAKVTKLDIPVYFFSGKNDLTVNHDLSKEYLKNLESPLKGFYTFSNSAHSPMFEESDRLKEILENDVLKGLTNLSDKE
ncbi:MAG: alpha/beta hydrolase [Paludibacter sp.]|jgi:pimeloyl-ACP methyl ester carboxylesterase|nr:alpha/beta hydrolase [Paludibacter sp.]